MATAINNQSRVSDVLQRFQDDILEEWIAHQTTAITLRRDLLSDTEMREQSRRFLDLFQRGMVEDGRGDIHAPAWAATREMLDDLSSSRAEKGFSPSETATFIFSLKQPLFAALRRETANDQGLVEELWAATTVLDRLGLYTTEAFQKSRESVISRQQQDMLELSTPVVELWQGVLALPLIGTLDSSRTQVVMETLLEKIVSSGSSIAIIDITGVPMVDTLVAQHLLKTVAAARLMGADCIISGIRPQIAQTIVHLGVDLGTVSTKATLADAFRLALRRTGQDIIDGQGAGPRG
jgi:rsbT co-antagonist protein RsbR